MTILCLGPRNSGKTLLMKKLQNFEVIDETTNSIPTIGVNYFTVKLNGKTRTIQEVGGSVAPLWTKYLKNVQKLIYVVDASNLCFISAAGILLYSLLANDSLRYTKVVIVLTKMDVSYRQMRNEALLMLQVKKLQSELIQNQIKIIESSAFTGEGTQEILEWIFQKNTKLNTTNNEIKKLDG